MATRRRTAPPAPPSLTLHRTARVALEPVSAPAPPHSPRGVYVQRYAPEGCREWYIVTSTGVRAATVTVPEDAVDVAEVRTFLWAVLTKVDPLPETPPTAELRLC